MRTPRLYVDQALQAGQLLTLSATAAHHVVRVLRLRPPAPLVLFNGTGTEFSACLANVQSPATLPEKPRKRATTAALAYCQVLEEKMPRNAELPQPITLVQALPHGDKMDWIVEKMVECGVAAIQPLISQFGAAALTPDRLTNKMRHWQEIIIAASEQSGRLRLAKIHAPQTLAQYLSGLSPTKLTAGSHYYFDPQANKAFHQLTPSGDAPCHLLIGPEGGWSPEELKRFDEAGFQGVRLGPRILRCETAGIVAISAFSACQGWLS